MIPPVQAGFRAGLNAENCLASVQAMAKREVAMGRNVAMISIDSVCHAKLMTIVWGHGCPEAIATIIQDFLEGRTFVVRVNGEMSSEATIGRGVPQGSPLSPTLYSVYTAGVVGTRNPGTSIIAYADDLAIL